MILFSHEMQKFIPPPDFKFKLFDFKNKILFRQHPYQYLVFILYKYCYGSFLNDEYYNNADDEIFENYFKFLDTYYR